MVKRLDYFITHTNDKATLRWGELYTIKKRSDIILIFLLTYLFSVKPQKKRKQNLKHTKVMHCSLKKVILQNSAFQEYYQTLSPGSISKRKTSSFV